LNLILQGLGFGLEKRARSREKYITNKITIPSFGEAESLNVGIATAVVVDNWRRGLD
jgi:tRNA G18 (ribose-2'-O)-methylase SpoU